MKCSHLLLLAMSLITVGNGRLLAGDPPAAAQKKIVLIAGKKSHGPGVHEYEKSVRLLKAMLDTTENLEGYQVEVHFNGWPIDPSTLDDADTIMTISDGQDGDKYSPVPWMTPERMAVMRKQMQRGCGFITFHFSTFAPDDWGKEILEWGGGYFDWQDDNGDRNWYSAITTLKSPVELGTPEHPIARGLKPFELREEFYYKIRFRENDPRLKPIWRVPALGKDLDNVVAWAVERDNGGRGFGTTCGHFYDNWEDDQFRKMILNAIVWTAHGEVPKEGVEATFYPDDEVARLLAGPPVEALIVTGHQYPGHLWKDTTPAIREALERDVRMKVSVIEEVEFLARPELNDYDVVILNYCNWKKPGLSDAAKANFVKYLQDGGGLTIVHFTNGAFHFSLPEAGDSDWPEWRTNICRRVWDHTEGKSGHDAYGPFIVEIAKPEHPIVAGMEAFETTDELYFRQQGDQPIEVLATAKSKVTGQNEPQAFIYNYGKGRVFQTVLGHSADSLRTDGTAELVCRGSLWAADRDPHLLPNPNRPKTSWKPLTPGQFGQALDGTQASAVADHKAEYQEWPITVECRAKLSLNGRRGFQLLVSKNPKESANHWQLYTYDGGGDLSVYLPGFAPAEHRSRKMITDDKWHDVGFTFDGETVTLFIDAKQVYQQPVKRIRDGGPDGPLWLASYAPQGIGLNGILDEVRISKGLRDLSQPSMESWTSDEQTVGLWKFDAATKDGKLTDDSPLANHAELRSAKGLPAAQATSLIDGVIHERIDGHWGEDAVGFRWTEQDSIDGRLAAMDTGPFFSGSIALPRDPTMKGICVKLGDDGQASACFDTELLRMAAGWTGGFLEHSPVRYGLIAQPKPVGAILFQLPAKPGWDHNGSFADSRTLAGRGPLPREHAKYRGLYRYGKRVVFHYTVGGDDVWESPWAETSDGKTAITRTIELGPSRNEHRLLAGRGELMLSDDAKSQFQVEKLDGEVVLIIPPHEQRLSLRLAYSDNKVIDCNLTKSALSDWMQGGPSLWAADIVTQGVVGKPSGDPYVIDTITMPYDNPYRALMFAGGHDFFLNGDAALCTVHGDVWRISGIDDALQQIRWKRFATGLYQPLGVKIVNDVVYVVGRDQITRLHDLNNDGEADFFENFNNDAHVTPNGHEYVTCLETDSKGNFYYIKSNANGESEHDGSILRVSPDGAKLEVFATGFRNSNGMCVGPNDVVTAAPQEGNWTPGSAVFQASEGGFFGYVPSAHQGSPPTSFTQPICWLPRNEDNSSGGQTWVNSERWGPLDGQLLHFSYGQSKMFLVLREENGGVIQGGAVPFPLKFLSGAMRGRFCEQDGQLYVSGLLGWVSNAEREGCFQRVRYTGGRVTYPISVRTYSNGLLLGFAEPLHPDSANDIANYAIEQWNYRWSETYGSEEWKLTDPNVTGRDRVPLAGATLLPGGKELFLAVDNLQPVNLMQIDFDIHTANGERVRHTYYHTINHIEPHTFEHDALQRVAEQTAESNMRPGLLLTLSQAERKISVIARTAELFVPESSAPNTYLSAGQPFQAEWSGELLVPESTEYRFQIESSAPAQLSIDGESIDPLAQSVFLKRGPHLLILNWKADNDGPRHLRLFWSSERFPREPISQQLLRTDHPTDALISEVFVRSQVLYESYGCAACHTDKSSPQTSIAPDLFASIPMTRPGWVAQWLTSSHELRNDSRMPAMFHDSADDRQALADVIAFLRDSTPQIKRPAVDFTESQQREGMKLWETLGCIACHRFSPAAEDDEFNRISLAASPAKFHDGELASWIENPQRFHSLTRMPNFSLSRDEALSLEAWIRSQSKFELSKTPFPEGNSARGRELFVSRGCVACHREPIGEHNFANVVRTPFAKELPEKLASLGCIAGASAEHRPLYRLSEWDGAELAIGWGFRSSIRSSIPPADRLNPLMSQLRCHACHTRDGEKSLLPIAIAEDGDIGKVPLGIPDLSATGEKLNARWLSEFLKGHLPTKPRAWLETRMPAFPAWADELATGFAHQHGLPADDEMSPYRPALADVGELLAQKSIGLDCRQCHAVGNQLPTGDKETLLAPGINFALTKQRIRKDYYSRFVLDPPRYAEGTRMPKLSFDGKTTPAKEIYSGDASLQFESLWHFIQRARYE